MIIAISAKKQHGKDTVADIIQELTYNKFKIVKFADKLKDFTCTLINSNRGNLEDENFKNKPLGSEWDFLDDRCHMQQMTPRLLLQKIGTEGMRQNVHPNVWINATFSDYYDKSNWIITDMRFINEFDEVKKRDGITIRINRSGIIDNDDHISETALDDHKSFDYYIDNDSNIEDLKIKISDILRDLKII